MDYTFIDYFRKLIYKICLMLKIGCFLCLILSIQFGFSQEKYTVSGLIHTGNNEPLADANVLLLKAMDSTFVKGTITGMDGSYFLKDISKGNYLVLSSLLGFQSAYSKAFTLTQDYQVKLSLTEGETLSETVIVATKPLYEQKIDRMVINVENSIVSAGGSALEILERSPGVSVNKQNSSISVVGKEGVVVMINGKTSYIPPSGIVQLLDGMSADNISSIELITTPPANFDAEGNAGFINIVLKEQTDLGLNGSYSLSGGIGNGYNTSDNINFNYRKNKINLFGSYSFLLRAYKQQFITSREYEDSADLLSTSTTTDRDPQQRNHNIRLGLDVETSEKTIMGILLNAYDNKWSMDANNSTVNLANNAITDYIRLTNEELNHWKHFSGNYNIKHNFTSDHFLSFDIDYLYYEDTNPNDYDTSYFYATNNFLFDELLRSRKDTPITTWVSKLDYSDQLNKKVKIETGAKITFSEFENAVAVENLEDTTWVTDPTLTNTSFLNESILAAYGALDYTITDKTSLKLGLRYEYTDSKLDVDTQGRVVDRQFGKFFPTVFLNRKFTDDLTMNLSYSKRITRPTFNDLAPFVILFDPNTFLSGNAALQPSISNSVKYAFNYKSYILSLQYTDEDNSITRFQERLDTVNDRLVFETLNLDYTRTFSVALAVPVKVTSWWKMQNNLTYIHNTVRTFYNVTPLEISLSSYTFNSSQTFKFSESLSGELSGFYNGPRLFGSARLEAVHQLNLGVQKKFGDKWGTLKFGINDVLDSFVLKGSTDIPEQNIKTNNRFDFIDRNYVLTYSRNFGNSKLKSSRQRKTGADEEKKRVN